MSMNSPHYLYKIPFKSSERASQNHMDSLRNKDGLDSFSKTDTEAAICLSARRSDDIFLI